ncbi:MAG: DUF885 domain-containing protein [Planctomycetota bacterium]
MNTDPMTKTLSLVTAVLALGLTACSPFELDPPAESSIVQLELLTHEVWKSDLAADPLFATRVGEDKYRDRLGNASLEAIRERHGRHLDYRRKLDEIDRSRLVTAAQVNYDFLLRLLDDRIAEYRFGGHFIPITNRDGFHIELARLPDFMPLETAKDYDDYIARLRAVGPWFEQHIAAMRRGIAEGITLPKVVLTGFEGTISAHVVSRPEASRFYEPFRRMPASIPATERDRLDTAGRLAIQESVIPSYRRFLAFYEDEYYPAARDTIAACDLPSGRELYEQRVRHYTTLDLSPEVVHEIGKGEVQRIREEMQGILDSLEWTGSFGEFLEMLRTDERFEAKSPEELLAAAALICKRMDGYLPQLFGRLPEMPYGLREVPEFIAPKTTSAYYEQPAGDGSRAGYYFLNTHDLPTRRLYELEALSLHEAVPGHHLQLALQQELEQLPNLRRFYGATAFVEGWALYAERLGLEVGFYQDPYSDFGRLTFEMWRACRLVVDTGIHALGWSRQQAIDFMAANTALSIHNITTEVDRYIAWPGQALAYKMGELKIRELRQRAESELGEAFDLRGFHDAVLGSGAVPLTVLEQIVDSWIAQTKSRS